MSERGLSVVVLAAGFGTRMKSKTPKVLHKICGKEMLFCVVDEALKISDDVHIVLFNEADLIKERLESRYKAESVRLHRQNHYDFPGTAGALMKGSGESPKTPIDTVYPRILVLNGDMPLVEAERLRAFAESPSDITLGILELQNASGYGRVIMENDAVMGVIEEKDADSATKRVNLANAGIYCIKRGILEAFLPQTRPQNNQNEFYLTDIIDFARRQNAQILGVRADESAFMGVNSKADLAKAEEFMLARLRENALRKGVIMHLPQSIYVECDVEFEGECEVWNNVVIRGKSRIANSVILPNCVIEDAVIADSSIGPMARIRPKCEIKDSHIGNFVEVKASILNGVKAGHLSYLGDSEIGSGTNIGAGVITCNYDGVKKHKTIIGEGVFVGSDCQLIAPLRVESRVFIAAGSTISGDCKEGDLAIARAKQVNKAGFYEKIFAHKGKK